MTEFEPVAGARPAAGMVLRVGDAREGRYLRLTHVFRDSVYALWVSEPEGARYARRPSRMPLEALDELAKVRESTWGRLVLPPALSQSPPSDSPLATSLESAWQLIEPLVEDLKSETALSRSRFTALIQQRAEATQSSFVSLRRMLLRFYYFGGTRFALLHLPRGTKPGVRASSAQAPSQASEVVSKAVDAPDGLAAVQRPPPKRRGRQPILSDEKGRVEFVVSEDDIQDMVKSLKRCLAKGPTYLPAAHEDYLSHEFALHHPESYQAYLADKSLVPVTVRQYRYYIQGCATLEEDLARNLRKNQHSTGYLGSLNARGPGELYEIDSTGGRIYLVSDDDPPVQVGKPTIYLVIDRWSRFVVAAYLSLKSPSYEEVRHALLVAFTSRTRRFQGLKVDIDDERWPVGRMPAVLCPDRGSDFMSESMEQSVVKDLRIELTPLPPFCPDGKAIVERLIREVKRRMASSGLKGTYAERPLDPLTKKAARKAKTVAVHSLAEAYRVLIEIIVEHNNREHKTLRRRQELTQANVPPTPKSAYLWGLKNITGLKSPPFSDDDYRRMLLSSDTGSIANGVVKYRSRVYFPANEAAIDMAGRSTARAKEIAIRLDKTDPQEVIVTTRAGTWGMFKMSPGAAAELASLTLDEEEAFAQQNARLWARAEHDSRRKRVAAKKGRAAAPKREPAVAVDRQQQLDAREEETAKMKHAMGAQATDGTPKQDAKPAPAATDWKTRAEQRRLRQLDDIRRHITKPQR